VKKRIHQSRMVAYVPQVQYIIHHLELSRNGVKLITNFDAVKTAKCVLYEAIGKNALLFNPNNWYL
jgi:hypothetical protein